MNEKQRQELARLHRTYKRIQKNGYLRRKDLPQVDKTTEDFFNRTILAGKESKSLLNKLKKYRDQEIKQGSQAYKEVLRKAGLSD